MSLVMETVQHLPTQELIAHPHTYEWLEFAVNQAVLLRRTAGSRGAASRNEDVYGNEQRNAVGYLGVNKRLRIFL